MHFLKARRPIKDLGKIKAPQSRDFFQASCGREILRDLSTLNKKDDKNLLVQWKAQFGRLKFWRGTMELPLISTLNLRLCCRDNVILRRFH